MSRYNPDKHYTGELAYYDSLRGLIPVKVIKVRKNDSMFADSCYPTVSVKVTGKTSIYPYRTGEVINTNYLNVIPRDKVVMRSGQYRIVGNAWEWLEKENDN